MKCLINKARAALFFMLFGQDDGLLGLAGLIIDFMMVFFWFSSVSPDNQ
jgi:hypothetical protein